MSLIEKTILAISPKWAFERERYRAAHEVLSYDAAGKSRRTAGWATGSESANAEFGVHGYDLDTVIARSRDLVRNTPYAARAVSITAASIWGTGCVPRLDTKDRETKKAVRDDFERFSDNCDPEGLQDFYGKGLSAVRAALESGGALIQWLPRPNRDGYEFPLQCRVLEPDYIDKRKNGDTGNGGYTIHGVEYDAAGRRRAYWLFDRHPGDTVLGRLNFESKRVPSEYIDHIFHPLRPGQVHGVPCMAPVILRAKDINDYDSNEVRRKKIETAIAMIVERNGTAGGALGKTESQGNGRKKETVKPETILYMQNNETVKFPNPTHVQGYGEFMSTQLHAMAAGAGCTFEQLTGDLSDANYSSARVGMIEFYKLIDTWQWLVMMPMLCRPAWRRFQNVRRVLHGDKGQGKAIWAMPVRQWIDPEKEENAKRISVRSGFRTIESVIAEQGEDADEVFEAMAETNKKLDALGLVLDSDPRKTSAPGGAPVSPDQAEKPEKKKGDKKDA